MLDHFSNMTEIDPPRPQEFELRMRQQSRALAHQALKEILEDRNSVQPGQTGRSLLERIAHFFGAPTRRD